ncbi:sensor histidine kinase [Thiovibrio frasassiensis]|uniref:histidine kinase n=1 Tax=Thiovibrio frasassiensis TaxID=2984131 RepID=A0A9X4RMG5_9BACT|nr:sensor histidine kinase [Thiovibrio frasassiensis]MDG4477066.1 sensor histidine kinase [Thiovibrio frasassiensis]
MQADKWEEAYLAQSQDAAVGRMFRGIIHNLGGIIQVFSLHTDLSAMMLDKAMAVLAQMRQAGASPELDSLHDLLTRRADALSQMQEKVVQSQQILQRTQILPDFLPLPGGVAYTVNSVIATEVEFMSADSVFKHKVRKTLNLAEPLPALARFQLELHQIIHILLSNALEAVQGQEDAEIVVESFLEGEGVGIRVTDNGPGLGSEAAAHCYEPFFSTKEGHLGLGLYLAKKLISRCGGELSHKSSPGSTGFSLLVPVEAMQV